MTRDCIDFETKHVIIRCLKKRGKRVFRAIPLPAAFLDFLKGWFRNGEDASQLLWPWSRMTGYRRICEVMDSAGIRGAYASPKGLRHGFGVRAIQSGVPLTLVQRWLGHADIKTTAIYTSAMGPEEREIASRMWRQAPISANDFKVDKVPAEEPHMDGGKAESAFCSGGTGRPVVKNDSRQASDIEASAESSADTLMAEAVWLRGKSIKSIAMRLTSCSVIHFWLKCHRENRYFSKAY